MCPHLPLSQQLLERIVKRHRRLAQLRIRILGERHRPIASHACDCKRNDPLGLHDLAGRGEVGRVRVHADVAAAGAADSLIADLHAGLLGNAVDSVSKAVLGQLADISTACGRAIVKDMGGAEGLDEVKVLGGAGCYGFETAAVDRDRALIEGAVRSGDKSILRFEDLNGHGAN